MRTAVQNEECAALAAFRQPDGWLIFRRPVQVRLARRIRTQLLSRGTVREATLCPADLERATSVFAANSVRAMFRYRVLDDDERSGVRRPQLESGSSGAGNLDATHRLAVGQGGVLGSRALRHQRS